MSNYSGGRMLNEVLKELDKLELLDKKSCNDLVQNVLNIGDNYDCLRSDILRGFEDKFKLCHCCYFESDNLLVDLCPECRD